MQPAIFLDRDGVVIENRSNYVRRWDDVDFIPNAVQALIRYASSKYQFVFITNQSAVGRGLVTLERAEAINKKIIHELEKEGCRIDGAFICPHAPEDNCACRKPEPGLLLQAAHKLPIDLTRSVMIGDAWTDLLAGQAAGVAKVALVLTGRGRQQMKLTRPPDITNSPVYDDLAEALEHLLLG
ncbi:D-glycero-alpha-D-manno-heptose-1,7-bisphosphate 7-phosphatase [Chloroflexota bacterium]